MGSSKKKVQESRDLVKDLFLSRDSKREAEQRQAQFNKELEDLKKMSENRDEKNVDIQQEERKKQKKKSTAGTGRRDTILTGPLGVIGEPQTANKTLLGI